MARRGDPNPFGPGVFRFLRTLARNNDRAWFETHKQRYEDEEEVQLLIDSARDHFVTQEDGEQAWSSPVFVGA